ncbi:GspE/PulE family protein [uncultured Helicobacter sp.]|uniref:GspE/PulE family protein n=1 Tax=uncultured Helicobacter sp. TaxID=175537 RepID=UPI002633080F|nr:GspE/PulE family protein [uncultured Helicobacter sp.]
MSYQDSHKHFSFQEIHKDSALRLKVEQMRYFGAILVQEASNTLEIALLKSLNNPHKDTLQNLFEDYILEFGTMDLEDFEKALIWLEQEEYLQNLLKKIQQEINQESQEKDSSIQSLVRFILQIAVSKNASDVHFERDFNHTRVRFRIDGVLVERFLFDEWLFAPLSASIKLISHLNLTESKLPQDGRFELELLHTNNTLCTFDFRVSTLPLIEGESIVLRILDKHKTLLPLESLGFGETELTQIQSLFNLPYGLVLVTGPTGSGKSTTMYGILNILKDRNLKIITLEDPVEYRLPHINQVAISSKVGFANILRNVLRQDPDVIILGEVRDKESLQIAIQAAFTGHLVFATLHTNDALDTIVRLRDMGLEPHFIAQSLSGIIAQRLLRKLCTCQQNPHDITGQNTGCESCNHTGYLGRIAIAEIVLASPDLEEFIYHRINKIELLKRLERRMPNFTLEQKAHQLATNRITDTREVYRVVK